MFRYYQSYDQLKPLDGCKKLPGFVIALDELYQSALSLAKSFDISDSIPRRGGRQTTRANHPARKHQSTFKQYFVLSIFGRFDYKLETRLVQLLVFQSRSWIL
jgi:hypothetical protein